MRWLSTAVASIRPISSFDARAAAVIVIASLVSLVLGAVLASYPLGLRVVVAVMVFCMVAVLGTTKPGLAVAITLSFLPFLGLVRRLLSGPSGWTSYDPLLLVAPGVCLVLLLRPIVLRKLSAPDLLSLLIGLLLLVAVLEAANPGNGGLLAGLIGLVFAALPALWFFVGRELPSSSLMRQLEDSIVVIGVIVAVYGLMQTTVGFPQWDAAWVSQSGYASLAIGDVTRAFGTFASSAEYATYLGVALAMALLAAVSGRRIFILAVPILAAALFLDSNRSAVVLAAAAAVAVLALRIRRSPLAVATAAGLVALIVIAGGILGGANAASPNPLIAHQVGGLIDPFNPQKSTLLAHIQLVIDGFRNALIYPLGLGTAATNIAGQRLGSTLAGTEFDVSNAFVSFGLLGGALYLAILFVVFKRCFSIVLSTREAFSLGALAILIVGAGQWLNGGFYAVSPLVWFVIGSVDRAWLARRAESLRSRNDCVRALAVSDGVRRWR